MTDYTRVQNDTGNPVEDRLTSNGTADDLTAATVAFTMWRSPDDTMMIEENTSNVVIEPAGTGTVRYKFQAGDLASPGLYDYEWEVTFSDGEVVTYRGSDGSPKTIKVVAEGS